eukprot:5399727-Prymnesium_polylepis.1
MRGRGRWRESHRAFCFVSRQLWVLVRLAGGQGGTRGSVVRRPERMIMLESLCREVLKYQDGVSCDVFQTKQFFDGVNARVCEYVTGNGRYAGQRLHTLDRAWPRRVCCASPTRA